MTALEITKLCAEAMDLQMDAAGYIDMDTIYQPLYDDAQAMALVKIFDMVIEREKDKTFGVTLFWGCYKNGKPVSVVRQQPDLNRAICECVAKMQQAKHPSGGEK